MSALLFIQQIIGQISSTIIFATIAVVLFAIPFFRRIIFAILTFISGIFLFVLSIWSAIFWKPTEWLLRIAKLPLILNNWPESMLEKAGSIASTPLTRGERQHVAHSLWPPEKFSFLYKEVPADIIRPLYEDGKLIGGYPLTWLVDRYVTKTVVEAAFKGAILAGLVATIPVLTFYLLEAATSIYFVIADFIAVDRPILEKFWPGQEAVSVGFGEWTWLVIVHIARQLWEILLSILLFLLPLIGVAIAIALITAPGIVYFWRKSKASNYLIPTKDSDVRWPYRAEIREVLNSAYCKQVDLASGYLLNSRTYPIGNATGTLRLRGDLSAPSPGQSISIDQDSLFQHLIVFGGTGEGKTSGVLRPLLQQLMPIKNYGFFVCDAKGVLWHDAMKVAAQCGRTDDVIVIGSRAEHKGVDPISRLSPTQVAAALRSVMWQNSGSSSDNFWPDMAANIIRNVLTIARSYAFTGIGKAEAARGVNPYSLWWSYQAIINESILFDAINEIRAEAIGFHQKIQASDDDDATKHRALYDAIMSPECHSSIEYLENTWKSMATETKSGIIANVSQLLDGFSGSSALRERFACGKSDNTTTLSEALNGKIVLNALSSIEDGLPARIVSILLKTTLYREARAREADWKAGNETKNPQDLPCIVMMDEVQEIVTADPASGLSDATFWNVARSAGLAGIFATQTVAALKQAMSEASSANFLQQARSKIFLRSEDKDTIEYACWCAGAFERNRVYDDALYESIEYKELLTGKAIFEPVDESNAPVLGPLSLFSIALDLISLRVHSQQFRMIKPFRGTEARPPTDILSSAPRPNYAAHGLEQQAIWREQDREWRYRTTGNEICPALRPADILNMGRWHAYALVQRAGAMRQDIITIEHDHG